MATTSTPAKHATTKRPATKRATRPAAGRLYGRVSAGLVRVEGLHRVQSASIQFDPPGGGRSGRTAR